MTGATGLVGGALLARLTARREPVRCLVRDPRRLGPERVRVQIALGDLADPASFRHALRGVKTVVHLAASERDQPRATIEELCGVATWRMLRGAERAGVERFVFLTPLGATPWQGSRLHRAKALAEQAVEQAGTATTVFACSLIYAPRDRRLRLVDRIGRLPVLPVTGLAGAASEPIWADDVAECIVAALDRPRDAGGHERFELAGPQRLSHLAIADLAVRAAGRRARVLDLPPPVTRPLLRAYEALTGPAAFTTWDEVELLSVSMLSDHGTRDAEALGIKPKPMGAVLGVT